MRSELVRLSTRMLPALWIAAATISSAEAAVVHPGTPRGASSAPMNFGESALTPGVLTSFASMPLYPENLPPSRADAPPLAWRVATVASLDADSASFPYREPARASDDSKILSAPVATGVRSANWSSVFATLMLVAFFLFRRVP